MAAASSSSASLHPLGRPTAYGESRGAPSNPLGQTRGRLLEADYRGFRTLVLSLEGPPGGPAPGRILARFTLP
jgi:hypothetical protein